MLNSGFNKMTWPKYSHKSSLTDVWKLHYFQKCKPLMRMNIQFMSTLYTDKTVKIPYKYNYILNVCSSLNTQFLYAFLST